MGTNWDIPVGHRHPPLSRGTEFESWECHMSPRVRIRHEEFIAELAWSGSGSRSGITPAVGSTVHYPPPPQKKKKKNQMGFEGSWVSLILFSMGVVDSDSLYRVLLI
ncbi:hypothetical protein Hanom_Chr02g00169101 [Helianthus anomalus]